MKSVLISIQPKWCELIASGKKTVEVRKTKPKIETPFKCYIYCTKDHTFAEKTLRGFSDDGKAIYYKANKGKVIGEFVCDDITKIINCISSFIAEDRSYCELQTMARASCLDFLDMKKYFGDKDGYAWHISDLVIYDEPRELSEFASFCYKVNCCGCEHFQVVENLRSPFVGSGRYNIKCVCDHLKPLKRPPQSWCYVEGDNNEHTD